MRQNQREVIRVDPDDAELGVVGVVSGHIFQDLQEFIAIWEQQQRNLSLPSGAKDNEQGKKKQGNQQGKGTNLDLPPQQMQQYVFHPCRPPRNSKKFTAKDWFTSKISTNAFM